MPSPRRGCAQQPECGWVPRRKECFFLQGADGEDEREPNLFLHGHVQVPDGDDGDGEHEYVGSDVDGRRRCHQGEDVDAGLAWGPRLADTFEEHSHDQGHAVQQVEPDDKPDGVEHLILAHRRWSEDAEEHEQD